MNLLEQQKKKQKKKLLFIEWKSLFRKAYGLDYGLMMILIGCGWVHSRRWVIEASINGNGSGYLTQLLGVPH